MRVPGEMAEHSILERSYANLLVIHLVVSKLAARMAMGFVTIEKNQGKMMALVVMGVVLWSNLVSFSQERSW